MNKEQFINRTIEIMEWKTNCGIAGAEDINTIESQLMGMYDLATVFFAGKRDYPTELRWKLEASYNTQLKRVYDKLEELENE